MQTAVEVQLRPDKAFGQIVVPNLTELLLECEDCDLRPMVHVERIYPFSYHFKKVLLPKIDAERISESLISSDKLA